jgi:hypothetical protein
MECLKEISGLDCDSAGEGAGIREDDPPWTEKGFRALDSKEFAAAFWRAGWAGRWWVSEGGGGALRPREAVSACNNRVIKVLMMMRTSADDGDV